MWEGRQDRAPFVEFEMTSRQEAVNRNSTRLQTKDREAVVSSLPIPMSDLYFYDFEDGAPVLRWRSAPSGSS